MDNEKSTNDQEETQLITRKPMNESLDYPIGSRENNNSHPSTHQSSYQQQAPMSRVGSLITKENMGRSLIQENMKGNSRTKVPIDNAAEKEALVDAISTSLASFAKAAVEANNRRKDDDEGVAGVDSSSSSGGDQGVTPREPLNSSDNTSGSGNVVTATQTTSSGDDTNAASGGGTSGGVTSEYSGRGSEVVRQHAHHHRSRHRTRANDGSALQVPGDDGSNRLAGGPATVVASRLYPQNSDTTTNTSSSGSGGEGDNQESLLQPHREPGYHTIRRTLSKLPRRDSRRDQKGSTTDSSSTEEAKPKKAKTKAKTKHSHPKDDGDLSPLTKKKKPTPRSEDPKARVKPPPHPRGRGSPSPDSVNSNSADGGGGGSSSGSGTEGGSSSGSGTEGGYAGSASSNEISAQQESSSSPSVSSSEDSRHKSKSKSKRHRALKDDSQRKDTKPEGDGSADSSSSSEIADFSSSSNSDDGEDAGGFTIKTFNTASPSDSPSLSSSSNDLEEAYMRAKRDAVEHEKRIQDESERKRQAAVTEAQSWAWHRMPAAAATTKVKPSPWPRTRFRAKDSKAKHSGNSPILNVGSDIMAHVLTFLQPPEILDVLTMPLSKDWRQNFTSQPELWRVLCLVEPFKAKIEDDDGSSSSDSFCSLTQRDEITDRRLLDRYRLLYTSFVRCMKYLSQIREDAMNGHAPTYIDYAAGARNDNAQALVGNNKSLQSFLARARGVVARAKQGGESDESGSGGSSKDSNLELNTLTPVARPGKRKRNGKSKKKSKKPKFAFSMITDRLLGTTATGQPGNLNLSWSCAIYSIVNWMVAFADVEGIQTLCMKVLPFLLEDEQHRMTAQRAGLTDVVLRGMVLFSNSVQLHIAAFHTIVLLARPLGGREGMLFHSSMIASGIFGGQNTQHRKNGIAVMVDSMRRFEDNDILQAMGCWALVNIALAPAQKAVLVKLGGIEATANAMRCHPFSAEVQFRALFALINLVIPSVRLNSESAEASAMRESLGDINDTTEREIIDNLVSDIAGLVVRAMKNFCSSEAILNRACLVLHNLSLTQEYHTTLLWTPNCYQMLEWCLTNYPTDQVLQQSATGTLHRLQMTMSNDEDLRNRFAESLQAQQQMSLEQAHREAILLQEQQERLQAEANRNKQEQ